MLKTLARAVMRFDIGHCRTLAPRRLPVLLDVEKSTGRWSPRHRSGDTRLIFSMPWANPFWGAPQILGELLKLGIDVSQATVSKYVTRGRKPPPQLWRTVLRNHAKVPTTTFRILYVLVVLSHERRHIVYFN